jgi:hypothetical protein
MELAGFDDSLASFVIFDLDVFDPKPNVTFTGFDYSDFSLYSPQSAVNLLRLIDSALVRMQENEGFGQVNLPVIKKTFAEVLATGSIITNFLNELFVVVEAFEDRATKTLIREAEEYTFLGNVSATLDLVLIRNDLTKNTEDYEGISTLASEAGNTKCPVALINPTSAQHLVDQVTTSLTDCGLVVCGAGDCDLDEDTDDYDSCACDIVVAVDAASLLPFIATTAYNDTDNTAENDILLLSFLEQNPGKTTIEKKYFGFKANSPATPSFVPRFRNWDDLSDFINTAIKRSLGMEDVADPVIRVVYNDTLTPSQVEIYVDFKHFSPGTVNASYDTDVELGDLVSISLTDASINVDVTVACGTSFAVVLGPNDVDSLTETIDPNCTDFNCDSLRAMAYSFQYEYANTTTGEFNGTIATCSKCDPAAQIMNSKLGDFLEVEKVNGTTVLALVFNPDLARVVVIPWKKSCKKKNGITYEQDRLCAPGDKILGYENDYDLKDIAGKKIPFQIMVGETYLKAGVDVTGTANLTSNIGGVIEATADLYANLHGEVALIINPSTNNYTKHVAGYMLFRDWLRNIVSILTKNRQEGFLEIGATFGGSITGVAKAEAPFDFLPEAAFSGEMNGLAIDFLKLNKNNTNGINMPTFNLTVEIEGIGNVKDLSFRDVVKILSYALGVLVGEEGSDVEDCSGGLLGKEVFGVKAFQYQFPGKLISEVGV